MVFGDHALLTVLSHGDMQTGMVEHYLGIFGSAGEQYLKTTHNSSYD
jgi:hypothetical protein